MTPAAFQSPLAHPPRVLLLGLGNDILTDDAIGLRVVAALRERVRDKKHVTAVETAEMGLSLLDFMVGFDRLVLVDAVQTCQAKPGFVHEISAEDLSSQPALSPHFLGVGEVLALGRQLGLSMPREVKIFAIEVGDPFTVGTELSPELKAALPGIIHRVEAAL
ncbi:MAG TPA: hydrogenase maturation protease [Verrucomicrobiota bacterium]|nr:hydrogenase maturation protease [Verrucomicrobiota bacterium]HRT10500.1 hydrogenase maturation protease [Candidatus Paceibacterota bacterium]HRT55058.1 hydrogenase maturation protease [Candidatus Paceibacterota bacterium]